MEAFRAEIGNGKWKRLERKQGMETGSVQSGTREWQMAAFRVELGNGKWQRLE